MQEVRSKPASDRLCGSIVWQFDTNKEFETVNGVTTSGGAIDGPWPVCGGWSVVCDLWIREPDRPARQRAARVWSRL